MDQWGDPLKPVPKWQNYLGYGLFASCMGYMVYIVAYGKYKKANEEKEKEELRISRNRKAAAIAMKRASDEKIDKANAGF